MPGRKDPPVKIPDRSAQQAFESGVAAFEAGERVAAAAHLALALDTDPDHAPAHYYAGGIALAGGRLPEALAHFERARALRPADAAYHFHAALARWRLGELEAARERCEAALERAPDFLSAHHLLAAIDLPGPSYLEVLSMIHAHLAPRTYLEIGVGEGDSLALASSKTLAVGVDPAPGITKQLGPRTRICAETSDRFFAGRDLRSEMDGLPVDLAFLDGMHRFEVALRDFVNVERNCSVESTILIHDCYPLSRLTAARDRRTTFWSGDVWRLIPALRKHRPELRVNVIATAPTGLGVVRGLDPASQVLPQRFDEIVQEFLALDYATLEADKPGLLALFPNDWERIKGILE